MYGFKGTIFCVHGLLLAAIATTLILLSTTVNASEHADSAIVGPYCGLYNLYTVAKLSGANINFDSLLKEEYLSSDSGSTGDDLSRAAIANGLKCRPIANLSTESLRKAPYPVILHVKSSLLADRYDHWIVYIGADGNGKARIFDPPSAERSISFG